MNWPTTIATKKGLLGAASAVLAVSLGSIVLTGANPLIGAFAAPKPPVAATPTITVSPANPTNVTSAQFNFTGPSGATFTCTRDGGTPAACNSGTITYPGLDQGSHTFSVTAKTATTSDSSPASKTWVIDLSPPPAPVISGMDTSTTSSTAQFKLTDSESKVGFRCSLDSDAYGSCDSNPKYSNLADGDHCLEVKAIDAAGNLSSASKFCWTIGQKKIYGITGTFNDLFYPGLIQPVNLRFSNTTNQAMTVDSVSITVQHATSKTGCDGPTNLTVNREFSGTVTIPGNTTVSLSELHTPAGQWPLIEMPNLAVSQDACKNATFTISYSGTAS